MFSLGRLGSPAVVSFWRTIRREAFSFQPCRKKKNMSVRERLWQQGEFKRLRQFGGMTRQVRGVRTCGGLRFISLGFSQESLWSGSLKTPLKFLHRVQEGLCRCRNSKSSSQKHFSQITDGALVFFSFFFPSTTRWAVVLLGDLSTSLLPLRKLLQE